MVTSKPVYLLPLYHRLIQLPNSVSIKQSSTSRRGFSRCYHPAGYNRYLLISRISATRVFYLPSAWDKESRNAIMKCSCVVFSLALAVCLADYIPILSQSQSHHPSGAYQMQYESGDGQAFSEKADVKRNLDNDGDVIVKSGHYAYTAPDGTPISLSYVADEYGFRASGSHIPQAPTPAY